MSHTTDTTFSASIEPLRGALRLHCYRMLGSSHDSDDLVQETLLRAWRARDTLVDPARLKPWLYRIATNACLDELARRPRRALASELGAPADPTAAYPEPLDAAQWLEPMPDSWLASAPSLDPAARYTLRESVALAFVAALQVLSPLQRATLLLRDVLGFSAEEVATSLALSVAATHSALHRARDAIEARVADREPASFAAGAAETDGAVLARYMRAIAESDLDVMLALIHEDLHTTMPPLPTWIAGRAANEVFYRRMFAGWRPGSAEVRPLGVNGRPGFAFHRDGELRAIEAVEVRDGQLVRMHHFMLPAIFPLFSAPATPAISGSPAA